MRMRIVMVLRARGRSADVPSLYEDPMTELRVHHSIVAETLGFELPPEMAAMREELVAGVERHFAYEAAALRTELVAARRAEEGAAIIAEARRLAPKIDFDSALDDLAKKAGVAPAV